MDTRHTVLAELLVKMGADENPAAEDAGRIEHVHRITQRRNAAVSFMPCFKNS